MLTIYGNLAFCQVSNSCTIAPLIVNYVFTVLKRTPQLPSNARVPRLQTRHRLVHVGFVHCGDILQTPTHYDTNIAVY